MNCNEPEPGWSLGTTRKVDLRQEFERVYLINLDNRQDRLEKFVEQYESLGEPFGAVIRFSAIEGRRDASRYSWWRAGNPAWGCYKSHLEIWRICTAEEVRSVLILEDDAVFCENFEEQAVAFLGELPGDWDCLFLGGQHHKAVCPPIQISENVLYPYNVQRTHAHAYRRHFIPVIHDWLVDEDVQRMKPAQHIDHRLGRFHQQRKHKIFCPVKWLIGQRASKSSISGKRRPTQFWNKSLTKPAKPRNNEEQSNLASHKYFLAVVGLHRSGSSCVAGVCHHLGVFMGNQLGGYEESGGFEARGLAKICESIMRFPSVEPDRSKSLFKLRRWINQRRIDAKRLGTMPGGKYPHLCAFGTELRQISGLKVLHISRPLEDSVHSLKTRSHRHNDWLGVSDEECDILQRYLWRQKQWVYLVDHLTVEYYDLLRDTEEQVRRIVKWLPISPTEEQIERAIEHVRPEFKRH